MRLVVACSLLVIACGDNQRGPSLAPSDQVVVVAHQDDDHLFIQPDLSDALNSGMATTVVYVTAGDANSGIDFATSRVLASKAAYGIVAGSQNWDCGWIAVLGHTMQHCRLHEAKLSLLFMAYPDGGVGGEFPHSLLRLFQGEIDHVETVATYKTTYTRDELIDTVTEIFDQTQPFVIRSLDIAGTHSDDHSDHLLTGTIAMLATQRTTARPQLLSYRGYNVNYEPATNPESLYDYVSLPMRSYEACVAACDGGQCGVTPCTSITDPRYYNFLHRRYAVAMRERPLEGILHADTGCLLADTGVLTIGDCTAAATVTLRSDGLIQIGDLCLDSFGSLSECTVDNKHRFMFDDEGHLWSAIAVERQPKLATMHANCLVGDDLGVRVEVCGSANDFRWDVMHAPAVTKHMPAQATALGRAVRMADMTGDGFADLCFVARGGLQCRVGDGTGRFGSPQTIIAALPITPQSLALGDVDFDGRADACGRDATGVICATAGSSWAVKRWSNAFAGDATTSADQSLAIVYGQICASTISGVICSITDDTQVLSTWPVQNASGAPAFLADLDGDGRADWCVTTSGGASCSISTEANITDDGVAWGFSNHAQVDGSLKVDGSVDDVAHSAVGDISGDGRADLCVAVHQRVECQVSQGHGFGPRRTLLALSGELPITGMWLGDLNGDGKDDPCVDDGAQITCALSP